jgi:hypothetical protein
VLCPSVDMRTDVEIREACSGHFGLQNPQNPMPSTIEIISAIDDCGMANALSRLETICDHQPLGQLGRGYFRIERHFSLGRRNL